MKNVIFFFIILLISTQSETVQRHAGGARAGRHSAPRAMHSSMRARPARGAQGHRRTSMRPHSQHGIQRSQGRHARGTHRPTHPIRHPGRGFRGGFHDGGRIAPFVAGAGLAAGTAGALEAEANPVVFTENESPVIVEEPEYVYQPEASVVSDDTGYAPDSFATDEAGYDDDNNEGAYDNSDTYNNFDNQSDEYSENNDDTVIDIR